MQIFSAFHIVFQFYSQTLGVPGRHKRSDGLGVITRTIDHCTSPQSTSCHRFRICGSLDPCGCNLALERPDFH